MFELFPFSWCTFRIVQKRINGIRGNGCPSSVGVESHTCLEIPHHETTGRIYLNKASRSSFVLTGFGINSLNVVKVNLFVGAIKI